MDTTYSFKMPKGSAQLVALSGAINQGIDSRLNAVFFDMVEGDWFIDVVIRDAKSLAVLLYRLWEEGSCDDEGNSDESEDMFFAVCDTLGLEDPWLVDNFEQAMPDIYYGSYEKVGTQFIAPLDEVVTHCLERGSAPTGVMMQA